MINASGGSRALIRVLLGASGHALLTGIATLLVETTHIEVAGTVESARHLLERLPEVRPDVVVVDATVAESLLNLLPILDEACARNVVLLLPDPPNNGLLVEAAEAGVRGLVLRDGPINEIAEAVIAVHEGRTWVDSSSAERLLRLASGALPAAGDIALTAREQQILELVANGLSNIEIAEKLSMAVRTVKYHLSHVLKKLGARDRAHAVALAYRAGFRNRV